MDLECAANRLDVVKAVLLADAIDQLTDHADAHARQNACFVQNHLVILLLGWRVITVVPVNVPVLSEVHIEALLGVYAVDGSVLICRNIIDHLSYRGKVHPVASIDCVVDSIF